MSKEHLIKEAKAHLLGLELEDLYLVFKEVLDIKCEVELLFVDELSDPIANYKVKKALNDLTFKGPSSRGKSS